jgi:transposase-like protein
MPEQRRKFSPQFKAEAVQMVLESGKPIAEVARDLGDRWAISDWRLTSATGLSHRGSRR